MSMYNSNSTARYLSGDTDPEDFSWDDVLTRETYLELLRRNGKIRKATAWVSREAIRPRFKLKVDKGIQGLKMKKPYVFASTLEYLEWIGFFTELEKAYTWSRLFGQSIIVMYEEDEHYDGMYEPKSTYNSCRAYYPLTGGNGYQLIKDGDSWYYKIGFANELNEITSRNIHKDRVVIFNAPHLELTFSGSSVVEPLAKMCIIQDQTLRSIMQRLHLMGAGIAIIKVSGEAEKTIIDATISKSFTYLDKIYTSDDPKTIMDTYVPDLNASQFRSFWDISQEEVATDMNMSKKLISGDPQGAISSAKYDTEISYTEVYQTQRHYKKPTEYVLSYLGIQDTTFEWNDPFPTGEMTNGTEE